jgi:tRNA(Arg) A34 adenosine deaminase TadA
MSEHEAFLRRAIELSRAAMEKGNHPFGAALAVDGEIVLEAENTVVTDRDATGHAELNLVRMASRKLDSEMLARATLYTSTEPCAMCAGGIFWAGIRRVVYACGAQRLGKMAGSPFVVPSRELFGRADEKVEVIGPLLEEEAVSVHKGFW